MLSALTYPTYSKLGVMPRYHLSPPLFGAATVGKQAVRRHVAKESRCSSLLRVAGERRHGQMNAIGQNSRLRVVAEARRQCLRHASARITLPKKNFFSVVAEAFDRCPSTTLTHTASS